MGSIKSSLAIAALLLLVGCQTAPQVAPPPAVAAAPLFTPEPGLSDQQRLSKAIALLSEGSAGQAEAELQAYLRHKHNSKVAKTLLKQINTPVGEYYPSDFVAITLSNGESLSTIAKQYLGDALQFYALAQYNNIANPGRTTIGQVIHVPLTDKAQAFIAFKLDKGMDTSSTEQDHQAGSEFQEQVEEVEISEESSLTDIETLRLLLGEGQYQQAIAAYEQTSPTFQLNGGDIQDLITAYSQSAADSSDNNPELASSYYQRTGNLIASTGDNLRALEMFNRSLQLDSDNEASKRRYSSLKLELTDAYHRDASLAFRRQELEKAIALWQQLLTIDPDHIHATNYLIQAQRLQDKLQRLE